MLQKANIEELHTFTAREGVTRRVFSGKNSMLVRNEIEPFAKPALHNHPQEQITYIVAGNCDFILGEKVIPMGPGDLILVPPNIDHTIKPVGEEKIINVDVFSPIREDYL
ncbi:MAG: cupin domain-containing protein [Deltaproteobacteria bacterium]|jgi:quercetin dioxygenase-like cupin family protein|nr:cupin domain-containing protein [Deltaproteobacteria bacterium]MDA8306086.1 cupin domain-containing protein [Deltaproteobacteria bacterium]